MLPAHASADTGQELANKLVRFRDTQSNRSKGRCAMEPREAGQLRL